MNPQSIFILSLYFLKKIETVTEHYLNNTA